MKIDIKKILCPVDFSDNSDEARLYAEAFAKAHGAELILMHCVETPVYYSTMEFGFPQESMEIHAQACERQLGEMLDKALADQVSARSMLSQGSPYVRIIEVARAEDVDLIVMGTHGYTGLTHVLLGSVAEKVVRLAPCPVLTVKHPEHDFVQP